MSNSFDYSLQISRLTYLRPPFQDRVVVVLPRVFSSYSLLSFTVDDDGYLTSLKVQYWANLLRCHRIVSSTGPRHDSFERYVRLPRLTPKPIKIQYCSSDNTNKFKPIFSHITEATKSPDNACRDHTMVGTLSRCTRKFQSSRSIHKVVIHIGRRQQYDVKKRSHQ